MPISPTAEGFRAAFRRPSLTFAEISWRWAVGATAAALFLFGFFEYLSTLPVNNGELLFLKTRQPYLVGQAIAHILRGSLSRVVLSGMVAALLLCLFWIIAASLGRVATVGALLDYFRERQFSDGATNDDEKDVASNVSTDGVKRRPLPAVVRLNFLRAAVSLAAVFGFVGVAILAGFASPADHPRPGLVFLLFLPLAGLIWLAWDGLNWMLSLAALFAVRDRGDTAEAISAAVAFSRERSGAVFAVSTWTGLAHLVAFVAASTVVSMPLGLAGLLPWRLVLLGVTLVTLAYFALADWLYTARLAGYVCIAETPEALMAPPPPPPPGGGQIAPAPLQTTIDRDEPILSDLPGLIAET